MYNDKIIYNGIHEDFFIINIFIAVLFLFIDLFIYFFPIFLFVCL